jgi:hypothetical protein
MSRAGVAVAAVVVALLAGIGSTDAAVSPIPGEFPASVVAVVRKVPDHISTISLHDFHHGLAQWAASEGLGLVPKPGGRSYEKATKSVVTQRLEEIDLQGQAREMGITAPPGDVARAVKSLKHENFKSQAEFVAFLKESHYTRSDVFQSIRIQILAGSILQVVVRGIEGKKARKAAEVRFAAAFHKRWRPRNICAPEFLVAACSDAS